MSIVYGIVVTVWYVCVVAGLYYALDYRIRSFLRERWLCWAFAVLWPAAIPGYMFFYLWEATGDD